MKTLFLCTLLLATSASAGNLSEPAVNPMFDQVSQPPLSDPASQPAQSVPTASQPAASSPSVASQPNNAPVSTESAPGQEASQVVQVSGKKVEKTICMDDAPTGSRIVKKKRCEDVVVIQGHAKDESIRNLMEENIRNRMRDLLPNSF
ncbi:hypothetical protein V8J88_05035 [Massilia sp. W12]|uniref:hypothetical protein n=1 Tax=Massilia sp. W12 TaxID=3126507 RepID=UPI0030CADF27